MIRPLLDFEESRLQSEQRTGVYLARYDYAGPEEENADVLYFKTPHFCPAEGRPRLPVRTVGLFNIEDSSRWFRSTRRIWQLTPGEYILTDVWSGEQSVLPGVLGGAAGARSRLFAVSNGRGAQLLDANIRINGAR